MLWETESIEFVLSTIDHFGTPNHRDRLLCGAAEHYGFDDHSILIRGRAPAEPQFDQREGSPIPPFRLGGHNLGMSSHLECGPYLEFIDQDGLRHVTRSVEYVLRHIDDFADVHDRQRLLIGAAVHYGLDAWALIDGRQASNNEGDAA